MESSEWRCFLCMEAYMATSVFSPVRFWQSRSAPFIWEDKYMDKFNQLSSEEKREFRDTTARYIKVTEERCFQHHYKTIDSHDPIAMGLCVIVPTAKILANFFTWNDYSQMLHWPDLKREYDGLT